MEPNFAIATTSSASSTQARADGQALAELERAFALDGSPRLLATLGTRVRRRGASCRRPNALKRLRAFAATRYILPFQPPVHAGLGEDGDAFPPCSTGPEERSDNMRYSASIRSSSASAPTRASRS